jgi:hypothetical protein
MRSRSILTILIFFGCSIFATAQTQPITSDLMRDSARSDKITGGRIEKTSLVPGEGDLKITINVPAFRMTLWQGGKEVRSYSVGVGMQEFPIFIGKLKAYSVEWNPVWIPPSSDWIEKSTKVKAGEVILPTDPRNPLGKLKIPLGYGYLLHQAHGLTDMGSLVSHGCVRVLQPDLYDLAEKIVAARDLPVTQEEIASAKLSKKTLIAPIEDPIPVEITYDTMVVESGRLHVYPDVYENRKNTLENLRAELKTSGVNDQKLTDQEIKRILAGVKGRTQFEVGVAAIESGKTTSLGRFVPVVAGTVDPKSLPPAKPAVPRKKA